MVTVKNDGNDGLELKNLTRGEMVKVLYNISKKFFIFRDHPSRQITFKEVFINDNLRVDILNINWAEKVYILELKTCRADFEKDSKWKGYLEYCDYFSFVAPRGVIKQEELPDKVGLIEVYGHSNKPYFDIVKGPKKLKPKFLDSSWFRKMFKKLAFRKFSKLAGELVELEEEVFFKT